GTFPRWGLGLSCFSDIILDFRFCMVSSTSILSLSLWLLCSRLYLLSCPVRLLLSLLLRTISPRLRLCRTVKINCSRLLRLLLLLYRLLWLLLLYLLLEPLSLRLLLLLL
ncbi:hypothetical protein Y883_21450, partial [Luteibacter rhizovicinus DSM 16549]